MSAPLEPGPKKQQTWWIWVLLGVGAIGLACGVVSVVGFMFWGVRSTPDIPAAVEMEASIHEDFHFLRDLPGYEIDSLDGRGELFSHHATLVLKSEPGARTSVEGAHKWIAKNARARGFQVDVRTQNELSISKSAGAEESHDATITISTDGGTVEAELHSFYN